MVIYIVLVILCSNSSAPCNVHRPQVKKVKEGMIAEVADLSQFRQQLKMKRKQASKGKSVKQLLDSMWANEPILPIRARWAMLAH